VTGGTGKIGIKSGTGASPEMRHAGFKPDPVRAVERKTRRSRGHKDGCCGARNVRATRDWRIEERSAPQIAINSTGSTAGRGVTRKNTAIQKKTNPEPLGVAANRWRADRRTSCKIAGVGKMAKPQNRRRQVRAHPQKTPKLVLRVVQRDSVGGRIPRVAVGKFRKKGKYAEKMLSRIEGS